MSSNNRTRPIHEFLVVLVLDRILARDRFPFRTLHLPIKGRTEFIPFP
jgi:hypothetical protein